LYFICCSFNFDNEINFYNHKNKENPMNKSELINAIANTANLTKKDSEFALNAVINCMADLLAQGESIVIPGFASLSVKTRAARNGRNPSTGKSIHIPASKTVSFKTGSKLKEAINS
jgi:DNA-binding protein HU-beta